MVKKGVCSALLIGVVLLCVSPVPALAHWRGRGGYNRGGVSFHLGLGIPVQPYYVPRPPVYYYPPVVYAPPAVVYSAPSVVYSSPPVVQTPPTAAALLQILVAPLQADIYLDGRYIGRAEEFPDGRVQLSVTPGSHTVELRFGTTAHTHTVNIGAGSTVVVSDSLS